MTKTDTNSAHRRGQVLIVDDSATNRMKLQTAISNLGHDTELAEDGAQALDRLARGGIDLVLLDIVMPGVDGFDVLRAMAESPDMRNVPVLVISSLEYSEDVARAIELGAADFLTKQFDPVLLKARVTTCLDRKWSRDRELQYLHEVHRLTESAKIIEQTQFDPTLLGLGDIAARRDSLGDLARVFLEMASQVHRREMAYRRQISLLKGAFLLLLIGLLWGLSPALSRLVMFEDTNPVGNTAWLLTISAIAMGLIALCRGKMPVLTSERLRFGLILGIFAFVLPDIAIFAAAEHVPAMIIAIALALESMVVFMIAALVGLEAPSFKRFVGLCLGLICVGVIIGPGLGSIEGLAIHPIWVLVALSVPVLYGLESILVSVWPVEDDDPYEMVLIMTVCGSLVAWSVAILFERTIPLSEITSGTGVIVPVLAVLSCAVSILFVIAIQKTGSVFASQTAYATTLAGVVWSIILLGEAPTIWIWAALALMMVGLVLVRPKEDMMQDPATIVVAKRGAE